MQYNTTSCNNITHLEALDKSFGLYEYLNDKEHKVFVYLCRRANKESIAYPSMETIAKECNIKSKSTVSKIIKKLEKFNLIVIYKLPKPIVEKHQKVMNVYEIQHPDKWKIKPVELETQNYINSKKFEETIIWELKKIKQLNLFKDGIKYERHQNVHNQGQKTNFCEKSERKDIYNKRLTKENDIAEEKSSEMRNLNKKQKEKINRQLGKKDIQRTYDPKHKNSSAAADTPANLQRKRNTQCREYLPDKSFKLKEKTDFERKCLSAKTRYKLYAYRQFYKEYLDWNWERLSKDEVLFFLINTEELVDNGNISFDRVLREIWKADKDDFVRNPVGWLVDKFSIGNGRFYFLLYSSKRRNGERNSKANNTNANLNVENKDKKKEKENYILIREDLLLIMKKYSIPEKSIFEPLPEKIDKNANFIFEERIVNYLWKNYLNVEEKQKIIEEAKKELRCYKISPNDDIKDIIKFIIKGKVKSNYVELSIEERIKLKQKFMA